MIKLGVERPDYSGDPIPASKPKKTKIVYPTIELEKPVGVPLKYGQEFTAVVKFRVANISDGEDYGDKRRTRIKLEALSMDVKGKAKMPTERYEGEGSDSQNEIEDALKDRAAEKG